MNHRLSNPDSGESICSIIVGLFLGKDEGSVLLTGVSMIIDKEKIESKNAGSNHGDISPPIVSTTTWISVCTTILVLIAKRM